MNINITIEDVGVDALPLTVTIDRGYEEPEEAESLYSRGGLLDHRVGGAGLIPPLIDDLKEA